MLAGLKSLVMVSISLSTGVTMDGVVDTAAIAGAAGRTRVSGRKEVLSLPPVARATDTSLPAAAEGVIKLNRADEFGIADLLER
jgi:hypothetical protein